MNLWEKIKSGFSSGTETISDITVEWSNLAKLRWEKHEIQKSIEKSLNELGGKAYHLHAEKRESQFKVQTKEIFQQLKTLEQQLQEKENEIEELVNKGVDKEQLKEFRKDLELGDGTIEQTVIEQNSKMVGAKLMEIKFPKNVLVGVIVRNDHVIIPDGQTVLQKGDKVTLLGEQDDVNDAIRMITTV